MRAVVAAVVLVLVGGPHAAAQAEPPAEIVDQGVPLVLGGEPAPVRVLNNTAAPLTVGVAAAAEGQDRSSAAVEVRRGTEAVTSVVLPPGGDVWLALAPVGAPPRAEITGFFVVIAGSWVVRRPIAVAAPAESAIVPSVEEWETSWAPLLPGGDSADLPGRVPATACPDGATGAGTVVSGHDTATVAARCVDGALVLAMTGAPSAGTSLGVGEYRGTLAFGDAELAVTVERSGSVLAALGWLLAGIAAAVAGASYAADRRPFNARKTAIAEITATGSLAEPVAAAKTELATRLRATRPGFWRGLLPWPDGHGADAVAAVEEDTGRLREAAARTGEHDAGLVALAAHRAELEHWMPGMAARFAELAEPFPADLPARAVAERVADAVAVPALVDLAGRVRRLAEAVEPQVPRSRDRHEARARVRQLTARLGRLARPIDAADLRADVEETTAAVDRLGVAPVLVASGFDTGGVFETIQKVLGGIASGTGRTAAVVRDGAVAAVVALVALWTGFAALYVAADTWGTLWDVLAAVTWGRRPQRSAGRCWPRSAASGQVGNRVIDQQVVRRATVRPW